MSQHAIVLTGSKQYWVEPNQVIQVELLEGASAEKNVELDKVLYLKNGDQVQVGNPIVKGAKVICEYLGDVKAPKVTILKYRRRKASRNKKGHRQPYASLRVKEIVG